MGHPYLRIPLLCTVCGIVLTITDFVSAFQLTRALLPDANGVYSSEVINLPHTLILVGMGLVLFLLVGLLFARRMTRRELALSASLVVVYHVVFLVLEKVVQLMGAYPITLFLLLGLPIQFSSAFLQGAFQIFPAFPLWGGIIVSLFVPYLFVLFGKKAERHHESHMP